MANIEKKVSFWIVNVVFTYRKFPDRRTEVHLGNFEMRGNPGDLGRLVTNHQCDVVDERNNTIILEKQNGRTSPALKLKSSSLVHEFVPDQTLFC